MHSQQNEQNCSVKPPEHPWAGGKFVSGVPAVSAAEPALRESHAWQGGRQVVFKTSFLEKHILAVSFLLLWCCVKF